VAELDASAIAASAEAATGLSDYGGDEWQEGLERLVTALRDEAALNDLGREIVVPELSAYLEIRLRIIEHRRTHPSLADADVVPPIVIVGQARTGTTILFDLLAQDPANRVPLTWEVDKPVPPPRTADYLTDPRIAEVDDTLAGVELVLPGFRAMHPMGALLGQECVRMTACDFKSMIFPTQYRVPSYTRWLLDEAHMGSAYRWHRTYLQHLQSEHPAQRWVLKSPGHIWCLGALLAEYPDALLVQTHRDPLRIVSSLGSLVARLRSLASDAPTIPDAAGEFADYILDGVDRSVTAREDGTVRSPHAVDVQFRAFMADPFATIREIYERLGLALDPAAEQRMRAFLDTHGQEGGGHRYRWSDTGLDEVPLRVRARRYQEYFGVPSEPLD
jgi:hypothetical protein